VRALLPLALAIAPATALAAEVSIQPRVGITILGTDAPTGGLSAGLDGQVLWSLAQDYGIKAGLRTDVIGLTGGWYHMGVVAGPQAGGWYQWRSLYLAGDLGLPYGQLSTCRTWEVVGARQCVRWWNAWPAMRVHVGYRTEDMHIGLDISGLYLPLPWGDDVGLGLAASGGWR
jgi:hypothetical protein